MTRPTKNDSFCLIFLQCKYQKTNKCSQLLLNFISPPLNRNWNNFKKLFESTRCRFDRKINVDSFALNYSKQMFLLFWLVCIEIAELFITGLLANRRVLAWPKDLEMQLLGTRLFCVFGVQRFFSLLGRLFAEFFSNALKGIEWIWLQNEKQRQFKTPSLLRL